MRSSSTLRICCLHRRLFSLTPCMTPTMKVLTLSVDIPSVCVKVSPQLFHMASGSTSLTMMRPLSSLSLVRGTQGIEIWLSHVLRGLLDCLLFCRYVDAVMTIPKGTLFPMCGMNLAFNRELIGPAMYFGLMGDGQPIGRYDDMWAGWCTKVLPAPYNSTFPWDTNLFSLLDLVAHQVF